MIKKLSVLIPLNRDEVIHCILSVSSSKICSSQHFLSDISTIKKCMSISAQILNISKQFLCPLPLSKGKNSMTDQVC